MKIYNTLTRQKEEFVPLEAGKVKMYICGPTVYNYIHIGNGRPYVVFDTVRRYLEYKGYDVTYIQNFTDVDDKIINRAKQEGKTSEEIARIYTEEALKDERGLNIKEATKHPKVTEEIDTIIDMVKALIEKGYAYEVEGTVFYDINKFKDYGKLSRKIQDELESGARVEINESKHNPMDFVLWKPKKEGEPAWASPWGDGRPGWHIECSAMARRYLGDTIDIHAGGEDLIFPHHENEIAQTEAVTGKKMANYWLHNAFINMNNEKMSKSKGNFFTLREIVEQSSYEIVRLFLLSAHYRSPINFSDDILKATQNSLQRIKNCMYELEYALANTRQDELKEEEKNHLKQLELYKQNFEQVMEDDFNTADAISVLFELVKFANTNVNESSSKQFINHIKELAEQFLHILGLQLIDKENLQDVDTEKIEQLINERQEAKKNKDFKKADEIREQLKQMGIVLEDTREGIRWKKDSN